MDEPTLKFQLAILYYQDLHRLPKDPFVTRLLKSEADRLGMDLTSCVLQASIAQMAQETERVRRRAIAESEPFVEAEGLEMGFSANWQVEYYLHHPGQEEQEEAEQMIDSKGSNLWEWGIVEKSWGYAPDMAEGNPAIKEEDLTEGQSGIAGMGTGLDPLGMTITPQGSPQGSEVDEGERSPNLSDLISEDEMDVDSRSDDAIFRDLLNFDEESFEDAAVGHFDDPQDPASRDLDREILSLLHGEETLSVDPLLRVPVRGSATPKGSPGRGLALGSDASLPERQALGNQTPETPAERDAQHAPFGLHGLSGSKVIEALQREHVPVHSCRATAEDTPTDPGMEVRTTPSVGTGSGGAIDKRDIPSPAQGGLQVGSPHTVALESGTQDMSLVSMDRGKGFRPAGPHISATPETAEPTSDAEAPGRPPSSQQRGRKRWHRQSSDDEPAGITRQATGPPEKFENANVVRGRPGEGGLAERPAMPMENLFLTPRPGQGDSVVKVGGKRMTEKETLSYVFGDSESDSGAEESRRKKSKTSKEITQSTGQKKAVGKTWTPQVSKLGTIETSGGMPGRGIVRAKGTKRAGKARYWARKEDDPHKVLAGWPSGKTEAKVKKRYFVSVSEALRI